MRTRHMQLGAGFAKPALAGSPAGPVAGFTNPAPNGGFTLVETLVAIIVGLMVVIGVHQVFVAGLTTQTTTSSQADVDRRAQVAMDEITSMLRQASPSILLPAPAVLENLDSAHRDRIHFAAAPGTDLEPVKDSDGRDQDLRYWVENGSLERKVGGTGYTGGSVLATGVTNLVFTFYDQTGAETTLAAQTVRVGVTLKIIDGANWSALQSTVKLRNT